MVKVIPLYPTGFACNSYLVTADGKTALLIDAGQRGVVDDIAEAGLKVTHVLLTHGHFDHTGGCRLLQSRGIPIGCSEKEYPILSSFNLSEEFGCRVQPFTPDFVIKEGKTEYNGIPVKVIATPGHTPGSLSFVIENYLFTGDTLFKCSVGRTDFYGGDPQALVKSVRRLYALPGDYTVYAGHDAPTTLAWERQNNAYVREE